MEAFRVEVAIKPGLPDAEGRAVAEEMHGAGAEGLTSCRAIRVFNLAGNLSRDDAGIIAADLLADPVTDRFAVDTAVLDEENCIAVEVSKKPGVMDPQEQSIRRGIRAFGIMLEEMSTAKRYVFEGEASADKVLEAAERVLANVVIEDVSVERIAAKRPHPNPYRFQRVEVPVLDMDDETLLKTSRDMVLSLNLAEMHTIKNYFAKLGRNPTDVELETLAQTWSEHCVHKTLKGIIKYDGETIDNLLASTIARATKELDAPWCLSVFVDNAGVVEFNGDFGIAFKVETHNHPSAIEPYGGSETGIGGVIRDVLGTGLGAKPIANTDIFCFGLHDMPYEELPRGALHPARVMRGVVAGVRDYGNRMGIPTVNGAVYFDPRYTGNPLVYCGTVGLIKKEHIHKQVQPGDVIVVVGGRTGRDGIHGATFSSVELTEESETVSSGAVQIGNAIEEKRMMDCQLKARDLGLYRAVTDCGAGGLSSSVGEMGEETGAVVHLERVPLKYQGLTYTEIWISEAQERMTLAVPPEKLDEVLAVFAAEDVEATPLGHFTDDGRLRLYYHDEEVLNLDMEFLHSGLPRLERSARQPKAHPRTHAGRVAEDAGAGEILKAVLSEPNAASKEWIVRQYDHEVQANTILKPLVGTENDGPSDGAVLRPVSGDKRAITITCGLNPLYGDLSPYQMAANGIDEAVRNAVACGANPERIALLDNFSWGSTEEPEQLGALVEACRACYDLAVVYRTPFISGKDSLHNEFETKEGRISIPYTLLISAVGLVEDANLVTSMDWKSAGNLLFLAGATRDELGASHYHKVLGRSDGQVPEVRPEESVKVFRAVARAIRGGLVLSCHDLSEGGLAAALAESAFAGGVGAEVDVSALTAQDLSVEAALFSESAGRFIIEIPKEKEDALRKVFEAEGAPLILLGKTGGKTLKVSNAAKTLIEEDVGDLKDAWQSTFASFAYRP